MGATNDLLFATWEQPYHIDCFRQDSCSERVCHRILLFLRFADVVWHGHGLVAEAVSVFVPFTFHETKKVVRKGRSDTMGDNSLRLNGIGRAVSIDKAHFSVADFVQYTTLGLHTSQRIRFVKVTRGLEPRTVQEEAYKQTF
jgi:hypothetical protein